MKLAGHLGLESNQLSLPSDPPEQHALVSKILSEINAFFYQKTPSLPPKYISQFHVFWKEHHEQVLDPQIDSGTCLRVARVLENIFQHNEIRIVADTMNLTKPEIAQVRFFTAIQDFKIDIGRHGNPFEIYRQKPDCFVPAKLLQNELLVDTFLNQLGADSQRDKRKDWMLSSARLLETDYGGSAFKILERHGGDAAEIRKALTLTEGYGFSKKKADMLLRDLADLGVWVYSHSADDIDVMSDANTMRIALRTGILRPRIPLLASYLDVYCYQYGLIDAKNAAAWREVWHQWKNVKGHHRPATPASMDAHLSHLCRKKSTIVYCPRINFSIERTVFVFLKTSVQSNASRCNLPNRYRFLVARDGSPASRTKEAEVVSRVKVAGTGDCCHHY